MAYSGKHAADLFSVVPRRQLVDIFSDWLDLEDIGRFDSAVCNSSSRGLFTDLLRADCFVFRGYLDNDLPDEFYEWSIKRHFKVTSFALTDTLTTKNKLRHKYLMGTGRALTEVNFYYFGAGDEQLGDNDDEETFNYVCTTKQVMCDVADLCPNITQLSLCETVLGDAFCLILTKCTRLQKLNLAKCPGVSSSILRYVCDLPNLTELVLSECRFLPNLLKYRRTPCPSLQTLQAEYCNIPPKDLTTIVSLFPNLTDLAVSWLDSPSLERVVKSCPLMKVAKIIVTSAITDETAQLVARTWQHITSLSLTVVLPPGLTRPVMTEAAMLTIIQHCKALKRFVLRDNLPSFTFRMWHSEPPAIVVDATKSALQYLLCESIAPLTMSTLLSLCPSLYKIGILQRSVEHTVEGTPYPFQQLKGTALKGLMLQNCALSPDTLTTVEGIVEIVLDGCSGLTDASLTSLAQRCPQLEILNIANCPQLTVTCLIGIIAHCPELRSLDFVTLRALGPERFYPRTPESVLFEALVKKWCPRIVHASIG